MKLILLAFKILLLSLLIINCNTTNIKNTSYSKFLSENSNKEKTEFEESNNYTLNSNLKNHNNNNNNNSETPPATATPLSNTGSVTPVLPTTTPIVPATPGLQTTSTADTESKPGMNKAPTYSKADIPPPRYLSPAQRAQNDNGSEVYKNRDIRQYNVRESSGRHFYNNHTTLSNIVRLTEREQQIADQAVI